MLLSMTLTLLEVVAEQFCFFLTETKMDWWIAATFGKAVAVHVGGESTMALYQS